MNKNNHQLEAMRMSLGWKWLGVGKDMRRTSKMSALRGLSTFSCVVKNVKTLFGMNAFLSAHDTAFNAPYGLHFGRPCDHSSQFMKTLFRTLIAVVGFSWAIVSASSQCQLPIAEVRGKWPWDDTIFNTPAEMLQSKCTANLPGSVLTNSTVVQWTTPTPDSPYPQWFGVCYIAPTNPKPESPICLPNFTGGSCSGYDGSASVPETIVMDTPFCNGHEVGRLLCGGGYYRCPTVDPGTNIGSCGVGNPIDCNIGNKHQPENDITTSDSLLNFVRTYNSALPVGYARKFVSDLGPHWRHSFSRAVFPLGEQDPAHPGSAIYVSVQRSNGQSFQFDKDPTSGLWETSSDIHHPLKDRVDVNNAFIGYEFDDVETDETETYDSNGRLLSITARSGVTVNVEYDSAGLKKVTDSFGRYLSFQMAAGLIQQVTDPNGGVYQYQYDTAGNLVTIIYPDATQRNYHYNEAQNTNGASLPNALTGISDEAGQRFATFQYDVTGLAVVTKHAGDTNQYALSYPTLYDSSVVTGPLGEVSTRTFTNVSGSIKLASRTEPAAAGSGTVSSSMTYDANGNIASNTDFNGNITNYAYDLTRNLETSRTEAYGTAAARTITTQWHASYRLPTLITEPGRTTSFTYDSNGNLLTKTVTDTVTSTSRTWTYTYNSYGQVLTVDGPRTDVSDITTFTYYTCNTGVQCGQVHTATDAAGNQTTYLTYNADGQPLTLSDPNGVITTLTYDARQRLTSRTVGTETTSFGYTPTGLLQLVTLPDGSALSYTYDAAHRLTAITDSAGNSLHYTLDAAGNRTQETIYDPITTLAHTRSRVFDTLGHLSQEIGAANQTVSYSYDNNGNVLSVTDPATHQTQYAYDALNRLKQVIDPAAHATQYGYDAHDNLTAVTDPRTLTTSYSYNGLGDQTQLTSPDSGVTHLAYDAAGNLSQSTDARTRSGAFSYDAIGRVTQIAYSDQTIQFAYDQGTNGKGHLTHLTDGAGTTQWTYSALGRPLTKQQVVSTTTLNVSYGYNSAGQLSTLTTPSGQLIAYSYTNNKITGISVNNNPLLTQVTYAPFGGTTGWSWGNGTTTVRQYDTDGQLTAVSSGGISTYTFNPDGTIASRTDNSSGPSSVSSGLATLAVSATSNQLTASTGALARTYSYDAMGNTLSDGSKSFTYNDAGRMISATSGGLTTNYLYNALGQRVKKSNTTGATYFVYDEAGHLAGEYDQTGTMIQELVWLNDIPVATIRTDQGGSGAGVFYIHTDHLNAPSKITRPSDNAAIWRWDHDPYGNGVPNEDPDGNGLSLAMNLRFPGQYYDAETGLNYNYHRDYDPTTGRYIQSDPIGLDGGNMSTYAYVGENPINMIDEDGLTGHAPGRSTGPATPNGTPYPGFNRQDQVCSVGGLLGQFMNSSTCISSCCKAHDDCYTRNKCNASSWLGNFFGYRKACQQCNRAAESCIAKATTTGCSACGK